MIQTLSDSNKTKRKITVILVDRANYGRMKPVMQAIKEHPDLELQVICSGTMVLARFDMSSRVVQADGFDIDAEVYIELEGSTPSTMAKSLGFGVIEFSSELARLKPDFVLLIGDRYEALGAALAASYMNICLAHIQGGEVSGSIDESARHCISKLAHYHFPSTERSAEYLRRMGEVSDTVFMTGCPSTDIVKSLDKELPSNIFADGLGATIHDGDDYVLVVFHPVTTSYGQEAEEVNNLLKACSRLNKKVVWLWPNIDAGSDAVSATIRRFRELNKPDWLCLVKNFSPENYLRVMANAQCCIGNSSSFVRDSACLGVPVVLVGDRQQGREIAHNVKPVGYGEQEIFESVIGQCEHGVYSPSTLYGEGNAGEQIAEHLTTLKTYKQKRISYVD